MLIFNTEFSCSLVKCQHWRSYAVTLWQVTTNTITAIKLSHLDVKLSWLGGQGVLVEIIKVGMEQSFLGRNPFCGVVDEHLLQEVQPWCLYLLHAVLQSHSLPVGKGCLRKKITSWLWKLEESFWTLKSGSWVTPGQRSSVGVFRTLKILNSWSISESPWNSGLLFTISA